MVTLNVLDAVAKPDEFFAERTDDVVVWKPGLIVLVVALLQAVPSILVTQHVISATEGAGQTSFIIAGGINVLVWIVVSMVLWIVFAGIVHGLSAVLGADHGTFRRTAADVGLGFAPSILAALVAIYANWSALQQMSGAIGPAELQTQIQSFTITRVSIGIGVLVTLWQGVIWMYATQYGRGLDRQRAALVGFAPVAIMVGITLYFSL